MPLSRTRKTQIVGGVPLFAECSRRELEAVAAVADELVLRQGTQLIEEGAPGRELIVILDGEAVVSQQGREIARRGAGDFVGELALVTKRPRNATVTAATDLRVLVLAARDFERLLGEAPTIAVKVLRALAERLEADA